MATRQLKVEIVGDSKSLERALGRSAQATGTLGSSLAKIGKVAALAGLALGAAAAVGMKRSITAASDLTEQINKANIVFRGNQQQVLSWSKGLEQSFGLSQRAALEAAGTFGNMLVPMGFARKEAASMSEQMVQLAGDMASFNNASPEDTLLAIRSGLAGEAEPLRKFGVFLSEARVQQEALTETGKKNVKQLTTQEKTLARYNLILKDTKDTQGDFARSAGTSLANQTRILRAQFEDLAATVGKVFLPVLIRVMGFISSKVIPGIGEAANLVGDFWQKIQRGISQAPSFRAKVNVVFSGIEELAGKFVDALAGQIANLLPQKEVPLNFRLQHRGGETVGAGVDWDAVASDIVAALSAALQRSTELAKALAQTIDQAIGRVDWVGEGRKMGPLLTAMIASALVAVFDPVFWVKNWDLMLSIAAVAFAGPIGRFATRLAPVFAEALVGLASKISPLFGAALGRLIDDAGKVAVMAFKRLGDDLFRLAGSLFGRLTKIAVFTIKVLGVDIAINAIVQFASRVGETLGKLVLDAYRWALGIGAAIVSGILDGLVGLVTLLAGRLIGGIWSAIKSAIDFFSNSPQEMIGVALIDGIVRGWNEAAPRLKPEIVNKVNEAIDDAQQAIVARQGAFSSAFDSLVSAALSAFDRISDEFETKTEAKIRKQDERRAAAERQRALREAQAGLAAAQASGDQQAIVDAERAVADARFAIQRAADERRAAQERAQYEASRERRRVNFENQLLELRNQYLNEELTTAQFHARLIELFKKFEVPLKKAAATLGAMLASGLQESFADVSKAARALAQEIVDRLSEITVRVHVELQDVKAPEKQTKKRQHGGPVFPGTAYLVGENGPELFRPAVAGRVVPIDSRSGVSPMGSLVVNVYNAGSVLSERDLVESVYNGLLTRQRRIGNLGFA